MYLDAVKEIVLKGRVTAEKCMVDSFLWLTRFLSGHSRTKLVDVKETERQTTLCLAAAHALVQLDDGTIV